MAEPSSLDAANITTSCPRCGSSQLVVVGEPTTVKGVRIRRKKCLACGAGRGNRPEGMILATFWAEGWRANVIRILIERTSEDDARRVIEERPPDERAA